MPEGPEIAREADRIRSALEGRRVRAVRFAFPALAKKSKAFRGAQVLSVGPRGKAMLIRFDNELTLYSHNQLYGKWVVAKAGVLPRTKRQLRVSIETDADWALLYSASEIEILSDSDLDRHSYLRKLGPDALDPNLRAAEIEDRLEDRRFARRGLGALLLDQAFVAGLGNYLRSEICFEARVHPDQRPCDLDGRARRRLAKAILKMTRRTYETKGITLPASRAVRLPRERFWVFDRAGAACFRCSSEISRHELSGRRVYFCTECQPKISAHDSD